MQKTKVIDSMARTRIRDCISEYLVAYRLNRHFKGKSMIISSLCGLKLFCLSLMEMLVEKGEKKCN